MYSQQWELKKDDGDIQVYTRKLDSTRINEYKAVLIAETTVDEAISVLTNGDSLNNWTYKTPESKQLEKISDNEFIVWMRNDFPWPLNDRDNVSRIKLKKLSNKSYQIDISVEDSLVHKVEKNVIRMDLFKGYWRVQELDEDSVLIIQQMYGDPNGVLPAWIVNSILVTFPYHSFENLKEILEN
ncbi:START domain-containing protein [Galbibacter sp.]|uniref:START domain-containing protein n=1 Tax=Galbibacter sp. TaxID=2918471 RepID=UPI003A921D98